MSPLECDQKLEQVIREFTLRIVVPRWTEFDTLWETAIRVCERYQLGQPPALTVASPPAGSAAGEVTSSDVPSATDVPVQIHPPIAA